MPKLTHRQQKLETWFKWLVDMFDEIFQPEINYSNLLRFKNYVTEKNRQYHLRFLKEVGVR